MPISLWQKIKLVTLINKTINGIPKPMKLNGSWRTSIFGVGGLLTLVVNVANMVLDGNPATNPDWSVTITALMSSIALLFAKDAAVSNAPHPTETANKVK